MKKLLTSLLVLLVCFLSDCSVIQQSNRVEIVDKQAQVSSEILDLLQLTGVSHDGSLTDIVKQTQALWLRKPGQERWDIGKYVADNEQQIQSVLQKLGLCQEVKPMYEEYDYVLILGALFSRIVDRFTYAVNLWNQGIRFKKIIFLGGARPVIPAQGENKEKYAQWVGNTSFDEDRLNTETDLMMFVYHHASMSVEMKSLPVSFVDVPMLTTSSGAMRRPTTGDTIEWWLKEDPKPGNCLFISSQPYVKYQQSVVQTYMPEGFEVDTVGPGCQSTLNIGISLDNVARWLYQENKRLQG